jgi:hypothetical protein
MQQQARSSSSSSSGCRRSATPQRALCLPLVALLTQTLDRQQQQQGFQGTGTTSTVEVKCWVLLLLHWQLGLRLQICYS